MGIGIDCRDSVQTVDGDIKIFTNGTGIAIMIQDSIFISHSGSIYLHPGGVGFITIAAGFNDVEIFTPQDLSMPNHRGLIDINGGDVTLGGNSGFHAQIGCNCDNPVFAVASPINPNTDINIQLNPNSGIQLRNAPNPGGGSYSQIGHRGASGATNVTSLTGAISITTHEIMLNAGTGVTNSYAQIGHTPNLTMDTVIAGSILINNAVMPPDNQGLLLTFTGDIDYDYALIGFGTTSSLITGGTTTYQALPENRCDHSHHDR